MDLQKLQDQLDVILAQLKNINGGKITKEGAAEKLDLVLAGLRQVHGQIFAMRTVCSVTAKALYVQVDGLIKQTENNRIEAERRLWQ